MRLETDIPDVKVNTPCDLKLGDVFTWGKCIDYYMVSILGGNPYYVALTKGSYSGQAYNASILNHDEEVTIVTDKCKLVVSL